ncbi:transglycosylase SLT domain-containing protein [Streptomyces werraensis]|uniref:transglycosylase SLT domain-containing protein n=1 Tax=Streptomyces werraensis TaxID=68284 RepID=UPI0036FBCCC5
MADAPTGVRVGTAFIEINPRMDRDELARQLAAFEQAVATTYKRQSDVTQAYARLQVQLEKYVTAQLGEEAGKRLATAAQTLKARQALAKTEAATYLKAIAEVEKAELDSEKRKAAAKERAARQRERIALNTRNLEVAYGTETAAAYKADVAKMMKDSKDLSIVRINEAKQWAAAEAVEARKVAAEHRRQEAKRAAEVKSLTNLVIRQAQMEATASASAARTAQAAYTTAHRTRMAQILMESNAARAQAVSMAQASIAQAAAQKKALQQQISSNTAATRALQANANSASKSWTRATHQMGQKINAFGAATADFGRTIQRNITSPLLTAAGAMSYLGVTAADSMISSQTALKGIGISNKDTSNFVNSLKEFGVQTPYTVEDMFKYGAQYTRSFTSHGMKSGEASTKASQLVQAIGDLAAYGGNTDPALVERTLKAVGNIMESDRASLRNVRTIAESGGLDVQTLATMLGFKDRKMSAKEIEERQALMEKMGVEWEAGTESKASSQMMLWMAQAAKTGGVPGLAITDALMKKAKRDAGSLTDESAARKMGAATVKGRLSNMFEATKFGLADFFVSEDPESGLLKYTGAGAKIMGTPKPVYETNKDGSYKLDKKGNRIVKGYEYEGGILEELGSLGSDLKKPSGELINGLFDVLGEFSGWLRKTVDFLKENPGLTEMLTQATKWGVILGGGAIVLGSFIKLVGLLVKLGSPIAGVFKAMFKGGKGLAKVASQWTGVGSKTDAEKEADSIRKAARQQAQREKREALRAARQLDDPADRAEARREARQRARRTERAGESRARRVERQGMESTNMGDRRAQRRGYLNGGDTRNLGTRAWDRVRGRNSQVEDLDVNTEAAKRKISELEQQIEELKRKIQGFRSIDFRETAESLAGQDTSVKARAAEAERAIREADRAAANLKGLKFGALQDEFKNLQQKGSAVRSAVAQSSSAVSTLNEKNLNDLEGEFSGAKSRLSLLIKALQQGSGEAGALNKKSLGKLKGQVDNVKSAADSASNKFGGGDSSLISRVGQLNSKKTTDIVAQIEKLKDKLEKARVEASKLNTQLNNISNHAPGGGSSKGKSSGGSTKRATGGVLPGYTPGVDVHTFVSPTAGALHLSGGEAVMRPEWTAAVGTGTVDRWNYIARTKGVAGLRKELGGFAKGGVLEELGLGPLVQASKSFAVGSDVKGATQTMRMDSTSNALGGDVQKGIIGAGTDGSHFIGADLATKFRGIYDFITKDSWTQLRKLPIPNGLTQLVGVIGSAIAPSASENFWNDVWKGNGNVLERGALFMDHMFSTNTLKDVVDNLFGGVWDTVKGLWDAGSALVKDPKGAIKSTIDGIYEMGRQQYTSVVDMVKGLREIWRNPSEYAAQVAGDIYSQARESLPNLEGLFDFSGDGLSSKAKADVGALVDAKMSTPGVGDAVSRWTPQVRMVLSQLGLPQSDLGLVLHRIQVESGGNPRAINLWDSNAKAGYPSQGLMQTIPQTFNAYAGPYRSRGITDPLASIYAGLNYAINRYGSGWRKALSGVKGYATGTDGAERGWAWVGEEGPELVNFKGGETVLTHEQSMMTGLKVLRGYASGTTKRTTGVAADALKGVSTLNSAIKKLYDLITKAFTAGQIGSGTAKSLNSYVDRQNKQLQKLVKERTDLATKLKDANAKLTSIKSQESEMATSISDNAKGLRSITDVFNSGGVSTSSAIASLKERLNAIKGFQNNIKKLYAQGFSKEIVAEIAQAGPEQGNAMALELLNSTKAQVTEVNQLYKDIGTASDSLGKSVAASYYAEGKKAAQSLVDGLTAKDKTLTKKIESLANSIVNTFRKKLKVSSKTPVNSSLASLLTWLTGEGQAVKGGGNTSKKKTTRVTTSYSTDSQGRRVTTVTTTVTDPAKGTTTTTTERTVGGKTTKSVKVSKIKGYWTGTRSASPGVALVGERGPELINFRGGERVHNAKETAAMVGPRYEIHVHEAKSENTTQSVLRAMQYAEVMANL